MLVATKHFARQTRACHDEYLSLQKFCRDKILFVATNLILSRQNFHRESILLKRRKTCFVATNTCVTKHLSRQKWYLRQLTPMIVGKHWSSLNLYIDCLAWSITKSNTESVFTSISVPDNTRFCVNFTFSAVSHFPFQYCFQRSPKTSDTSTFPKNYFHCCLFGLNKVSPWARYRNPPPQSWRQWFLDSLVCVFSISACLQDELLCF